MKSHICGNCTHAIKKQYPVFHADDDCHGSGYYTNEEYDDCKEGHEPREDCWHKISKQSDKILRYL